MQILRLRPSPRRRTEKRPFRTLLRPPFRRFSPFEKTAGFSPNSPFSASNFRNSPFFRATSHYGCQRKRVMKLLQKEQRTFSSRGKRQFRRLSAARNIAVRRGTAFSSFRLSREKCSSLRRSASPSAAPLAERKSRQPKRTGGQRPSTAYICLPSSGK